MANQITITKATIVNAFKNNGPWAVSAAELDKKIIELLDYASTGVNKGRVRYTKPKPKAERCCARVWKESGAPELDYSGHGQCKLARSKNSDGSKNRFCTKHQRQVDSNGGSTKPCCIQPHAENATGSFKHKDGSFTYYRGLWYGDIEETLEWRLAAADGSHMPTVIAVPWVNPSQMDGPEGWASLRDQGRARIGAWHMWATTAEQNNEYLVKKHRVKRYPKGSAWAKLESTKVDSHEAAAAELKAAFAGEQGAPEPEQGETVPKKKRKIKIIKKSK